jgi:hypothetical protein
MTCPGNIWNYSVSELRPAPRISSLNQLLGKSDIKGTCDEMAKINFAQWPNQYGMENIIIEHGYGRSEQSLLQTQCESFENSIKNTWFFSMSKSLPNMTAQFFHHREKLEGTPAVYFDRSCQAQAECHTTLGDNLKFILDQFIQKRKNIFLLIRDHSVFNALKAGNNLLARENLYALDKILKGLISSSKLPHSTLVLVTGVAPHPIEIPIKGEQWAQFEKKGQNLQFKNQSIIAPLFAWGANAENFCGTHALNSIKEKVLWVSKEKKFRLDMFFF